MISAMPLQINRHNFARTALAVATGAAVLTTSLIPGMSARAQQGELIFIGSTTVDPIVDLCEAGFEAGYPGCDVITYDTGSSHGIQSLLQGSGSPWVPNPHYYEWQGGGSAPDCDLAMASRDLRASDDTKPGTSGDGDPFSKLCDWHIAKDAVCVVVHDDPQAQDPLDVVTQITIDQIAAIYEAGTSITSDGENGLTWAQVDMMDGVNDGWPDNPVIPRARILDSGTRGAFLEMIDIDEADEEVTINHTGLPRMHGNPDMAQVICGHLGGDPTDPNNPQAPWDADDHLYHIGYVGLGFLDPQYQIRPLAVKDAGDYVLPSEATVLDGSYPISRSLHLLTTHPDYYDDSSECIPAFLRYMFDDAGQDQVEAKGFVRVDKQPRWDITYDGICNALDFNKIALNWNSDTANLTHDGSRVPGWIRADITFDGVVNALDFNQISIHWLDTW
ncbi:MAG: substrate-binding domain-containing protein [Chloroflexota bacterium]|nr:substrate-binding domain-containing protein [Chloroflexota bacterium]